MTHPLDHRVQSAPLDVLLVEDNPVNQKVAVALLTKWGHRVVVACDGSLGMEALDRQRFDLALIDIQMPIMDGIEAIGRIRARELAQGGHLPIIAITAHAANQDRVRCLAAGADRYLTKPLNSQLLRLAIAELLPTAADGTIAPATATLAAPVDLANLKECVGDDPELLLEIVQSFNGDTSATFERIARAITGRDARALETLAHRLKGSLSTVGAYAAADTANLLESMGREGALEGAVELSVRLRRELDVAAEYLRLWTAPKAA